jgi:hypothetical protein
VVDYRDPANPQLVSRLVNPTGTSAEDVVVYTARFGPLAGRDIAAAGLQVCGGSRLDESFARGLVLWDVTNPAAPVQLGLLNTGCCTRGVHELEVEHRTDLGRTFVYASVPTSEYAEEGSPSGFRDEQGRGDFRLIDVTNPAAPMEVSDWGVLHDAGGPLGPGQGCDPDPVYGHSAEPSADGKTVFLAYWDSGFVALDVTDPARPVLLGDTDYAPMRTGMPIPPAMTTPDSCCSPPMRTSARTPAQRSSGAWGTCGSMTSRIRPTRSRSASTGPRTRWAPARWGPATTRSTTPWWSAPPCTPPGTRTGSGCWM